MNSISLRKRSLIILSILALIMVMCGGGTAEEETTEEVVEETVVETLDSPAVTTARTYGDGFTSEPCPEAIGDYPTLADQPPGSNISTTSWVAGSLYLKNPPPCFVYDNNMLYPCAFQLLCQPMNPFLG